MTRDEIRQAVLRILGQVAPEADLEGIDPGRSMQEQFDLDSMDFLNFVSGIQQEISVDVPERDYPKIETLDACIDYIFAALATATEA
ncbi:MAG: phosphopantetheine-binding protein [Actinomycetota bacterium]